MAVGKDGDGAKAPPMCAAAIVDALIDRSVALGDFHNGKPVRTEPALSPYS
jgi:hypothetical protein